MSSTKIIENPNIIYEHLWNTMKVLRGQEPSPESSKVSIGAASRIMRHARFLEIHAPKSMKISDMYKNIYKSAGPSVEGPPGCEGFVCSLYICLPFAMDSYYSLDFSHFHILYPLTG